jgi:hypothetical protein
LGERFISGGKMHGSQGMLFRNSVIKNIIKWGSGARLDIIKSISYNTLGVMMVLRVVIELSVLMMELSVLMIELSVLMMELSVLMMELSVLMTVQYA